MSSYEGPERRSSLHVPVGSRALFSADRIEGQGILHDLSPEGARIEEASARLPPRSRVRISFEILGEVFPLWIPATVVRETETGFAVQFLEMDRLLKEWLHRVTSAFDD